MSFLKAVTIITLWLVLSFFWVRLGQSQERGCTDFGNMSDLISPHPVLADWYRFCVDRKACEPNAKDIFRIIAGNETLSTKLNQAHVKFNQIYSPLTRLISADFGCLSALEIQDVQSDLASINDSLLKVLNPLSLADQDYLRAVVILSHASDYGEEKPAQQPAKYRYLMGRLNRDSDKDFGRQMHPRDVAPIPYEEVFGLKK